MAILGELRATFRTSVAFRKSLMWVLGVTALLPLPMFAAKKPVSTTKAGTTGFNGNLAYGYADKFVACGPRWISSPGHICAENYIKQHFAKDNFEDDAFTASTPIGPLTMHNFIVRFPGKKDGVILVGSHYETNYWLRNTSFVGANDGGATVGLLVELANTLRGRTLDGYSVWLVFFDGEESIESEWKTSDALYGSRHLAARWDRDGTLKKIRGYLLTDMIGDKQLDILRELNSTPWLEDLVYQAAKQNGDASYFFADQNQIEDDQLPFVQRGVPTADIIDMDYGPHDTTHPEGYHHTPEDTMDKISARSLSISGRTVVTTIQLLNQR